MCSGLDEEYVLPNDLKNLDDKCKSHRLSTTGYTPYQCKCSKCQGILTLIRNDIQAEVEYKPEGDVDHQVIHVWKGKSKYLIHHVHCPQDQLLYSLLIIQQIESA